MKKHLVQAANALLKPLGAKIVRLADGSFDMASAIRRIAAHHLPIRSVIDIGASDGKWSREAMKSLPMAAYLAIEPLSERRTELERLRQKYDNFDYVLCVAGGNDGGQVTLTVAADLDGSSVGGSGGTPRDIQVRTVDAIVAEKGLEGPFLLKFDTHGYELPILNGAEETMAHTNVIVMEVYNFKITDHALRFHEMCTYMEGRGFRCYDLAGPVLRLRDQALWQMDIFFTRDDSEIFSYSRYQ